MLVFFLDQLAEIFCSDTTQFAISASATRSSLPLPLISLGNNSTVPFTMSFIAYTEEGLN
jgi:hypothetical protein